jgi:hypothetical protein
LLLNRGCFPMNEMVALLCWPIMRVVQSVSKKWHPWSTLRLPLLLCLVSNCLVKSNQSNLFSKCITIVLICKITLIQSSACGAPMHLVAKAHAAALDEIKHTAIAGSLSRRAGANPLHGPGAFDCVLSVKIEPSIRQLALSTAQEGCISETLSCLQLFRDASQCTTEDNTVEVGAALREIANDELRHAALAWETVQWALTTDCTIVEEVLLVLSSVQETLRLCIEWLLGERKGEIIDILREIAGSVAQDG